MPTKSELQEENSRLKREIGAMAAQLSRMERELSGQLLPEELPPEPIPAMILGLIREYKLPWECFWCDRHRRWYVLLDSAFPYYWEGCECPSCMTNGDPFGGC